MLIVPGAAGEIGVLARHAPLVAMLKAGSTRVHRGGQDVLEFATGPTGIVVVSVLAATLVTSIAGSSLVNHLSATELLRDE